MKINEVSTPELARELARTSREIVDRSNKLVKENARLREEIRGHLKELRQLRAKLK